MTAGISFKSPDPVADAAMILAWRVTPRVAEQMVTQIDDDLARQQDWLTGIESRTDYFHWLVMMADRPVGLINYQWTDDDPTVCTLGFYIGEDDALGLGGIIPPYLYNELFFERGVQMIEASVKRQNVDVLELHDLHGFEVLTEQPDADMIDLRLSQSMWAAKTRFHRFRSSFADK